MQIGAEAIDATADLSRTAIETTVETGKGIVEDSAWGLSMTVRAILTMLAVAAVCCAGRVIFTGAIGRIAYGVGFRLCCFLIDLLYYFLP